MSRDKLDNTNGRATSISKVIYYMQGFILSIPTSGFIIFPEKQTIVHVRFPVLAQSSSQLAASDA